MAISVRARVITPLVLAAATATALLAQAQPAIEPLSAAAGTELRINQTCVSAEPPVVVINAIDIPAIGSNPRWQVTLPPALEPKAYAVRWRCGSTAPATELPQLAVIAVTPVVPRVFRMMNATRLAEERAAAVAANKASGTSSGKPATPRRDALTDTVILKVDHLEAWKALRGNADKELHLYLSGTELRNVVAKPAPRESGDGPSTSSLNVVLDLDEEDEDNRRAWARILAGAVKTDDREIAITVGPSGEPFASDAQLRLDIFPSYTPWVAVFLGLMVVIIVVMGKKSNLLRDANGSSDPPYSLAKHQMAVWFVAIVGSYLYIWLVTGTYSSISTTALTLIGISGATGLIAVTMDHSKRDEAEKIRVALRAERDALNDAIGAVGTGLTSQLAAAIPGSPEALQLASALGVKQTRLNELTTLLAQPNQGPPASRRWYLDLLSDDSGVSFHRLQMAMWTVVLVMVFLRAVRQEVLMPDFDPTLLGLLGISSGTYLGFKFPEKP